MTDGASTYNRILDNLEKVMRGKRQALQHLVVALFAGGNVLLEDVPGVGKTTLAKSLARTIGGDFKRIQFTPDLLPTDILGSSIYNPKEGTFFFKQGPVFANILLADEINRASPRTQSSLLEAMSEGQVTIEGNTLPLPKPFVVLATQNPVEFHGTYPLPEAQLDRFALKLSLGYPSVQDEIAVMEGQRRAHPLDTLESLVGLDAIDASQVAVREVRLEKPITDYIMALVQATRQDPRLRLGSSPRGSLALYRTAQALAYCSGRDYVLPDDVQSLAVGVLAHRLVLDTKARYSGVTRESILEEILGRLKVPT